MSYIPVSTGSSSASAAKKMMEEEEAMTAYNKDDLDGWEFKIMRNFSGKFRDRKFIQQLCMEEAKAGWEMMEKFDDYRIRFKRKTDFRHNDQFLKTDPYRTDVGAGINRIITIGIMLAVLGGFIAIAAAIFFGR